MPSVKCSACGKTIKWGSKNVVGRGKTVRHKKCPRSKR